MRLRFLFLLLSSFPVAAFAQESPNPWRLEPGDTVEVRPVNGDACVGHVRATGRDTLHVTEARDCPRAIFSRAEIRDLRVARGDRGSRIEHTGYGMLIGGASGAVVGRLLAGNGCTSGFDHCDDAGLAIGIITVGGALLGAITGGIVGLVMDAGTQWIGVSPPSVVQIGGVAIRPELRLGIR